MSASLKNILGRDTTEGIVYLSASFMTAGTSSPIVYREATAGAMNAGNTARGEGLGGTWNLGTNPVSGVVRTGVGVFTVTLAPGQFYRYCVTKFCDLEAANGGDGAYASIGAATNEGGNNTTVLTFTLYTHAAAGTLADFGPGGTGVARRCSISLGLKDSNVGK